MLKKRLVATLTVKNGIVVQSIGFKTYLPVGEVGIAVEFLNSWGIDEIILVDIEATRRRQGPPVELVRTASKKGFAPLAAGGGIRNLNDIRTLIFSGADKVVINKMVHTDLSIVENAAGIFGDQCVVISIDARKESDGRYQVYTDSGTVATGIDPVAFAKSVEERGAGEILIRAIDRDGSKQGYDLNLVRMVTEAMHIPVIAAGGVGHPQHFVDGFTQAAVSACAAGNFFHFTEHSPIVVKSYLRQKGVDVRLDSYAHYDDIEFDEKGRVAKRPDEYLEKLRFQYYAPEVI